MPGLTTSRITLLSVSAITRLPAASTVITLVLFPIPIRSPKPIQPTSSCAPNRSPQRRPTRIRRLLELEVRYVRAAMLPAAAGLRPAPVTVRANPITQDPTLRKSARRTQHGGTSASCVRFSLSATRNRNAAFCPAKSPPVRQPFLTITRARKPRTLCRLWPSELDGEERADSRRLVPSSWKAHPNARRCVARTGATRWSGTTMPSPQPNQRVSPGLARCLPPQPCPPDAAGFDSPVNGPAIFVASFFMSSQGFARKGYRQSEVFCYWAWEA